MTGRTTINHSEYDSSNIDYLMEQVSRDEHDNPVTTEREETPKKVNPFDRVVVKLERKKSELKTPKGLKPERAFKEFDRIHQQLVGVKPKLNTKTKKTIESLVLYFINHPSSSLDLHKGIYLYGPTGTGKTSIMKALYQFADVTNVKRFEIDTTTAIVNKIRSGESSYVIENHITKNPWGKSIATCFDDLGMESELMVYGNKINPMAEILYGRYENELLTHATSNLKPERIKDKYGQRIYSRIHEMFNFIHVEGKDHRINAD